MLAAEAHKEKFMLPEDVIVADEISDTALTLDIPVEDVELAMKILDVGMNAISKYVEAIKEARVIVWNGPVGLYEMKPFERGTKEIAKAVSEATAAGATSILGGGDTIDAIKRFGHSFDEFTHVSTGGGAMLEFLEGKRLPGIEALG
jgi:phosphoglycerate kinase